MTQLWSGEVVRKARAYMSVQPMPWVCGQCNEPIETNQPWVVGHIKPRALYPELTLDITNWQHEHKWCSDRSGHAVKQQKAALAASNGVFSDKAATQSPPPFLIPSLATNDDFVPSNMTWDYFVAHAPSWLDDILEVPEDASPPLAMTPVHKESVGTYGPVAEKSIKETFGVTLRWWQRLCLYRQLEHREDGSLVWEQVIQSAPRRSGKSVGLGATVMWRLVNAELLGETQQVVHTAMNMRITKEIQRAWWKWAEEAGWTVRKANGSEEIETPTGDRWLLLPQNGITGYSPGYGVVDECWDVEPITISENLEPALMDRQSPQMLLTSTAHTKATSLMRNKIGDCLSKRPDPDTLLLLWGAKPDANVHDRAVWRAASPYHSKSRDKIMERKYLSALNGETDPEFDDMEPMEGFKAQYLNIWPMSDRRTAKGNPVIEPADWLDLSTEQPKGPPVAVAIESAFTGGLSVALAWKQGVKVQQVETAEDARALLDASGFTGKPIVGAGLKGEPAFRGRALESRSERPAAAVQEFVRLLTENAVRHIDSDLTEQVTNLRIETTATGIRIVSKERLEGIKAAVWAINAVRNKPKQQRAVFMPG